MKGQLSFPCTVLPRQSTSAGLDPAWCVSSDPYLPSHSLKQSSRGRRHPRDAAGKEDTASCHWDTAENVAAAPKLGEDKGKAGGATSALSLSFPSPGTSGGIPWEGALCTGHGAYWELHSGVIQDAPQY